MLENSNKRAQESSPFAKKIMEKALSSWDTKEKTKCFSAARSARGYRLPVMCGVLVNKSSVEGTISLTDCKTKCFSAGLLRLLPESRLVTNLHL